MLNRAKVEELEKHKTKGFHVCGLCHKEFIRQPGTIYKMTIDGKLYNFCSYTCHREVQKWKESTKHGKKTV